MEDRRFEKRARLVNHPIDVVWADQAGQQHHAAAILVDISASGASVRSPHPVGVGRTISFSYQNQNRMGKVKHCAHRKSSYLLGIEFI
jgi:hypothetical protein